MKAIIYLQAFVSSKDVVNIGTAVITDPDTGLSCKYNFCTDYTPGSEPTDYVTHQLLVVGDLEEDLYDPKGLVLFANTSSKTLKSILEYMEIDGANNISKNVVFSEEYGIMWRKDIQEESDKYLNMSPKSPALMAKEYNEKKLIEAAKESYSKGYTKPKRLKGYNIQINELYGVAPRNTIESDKYERDTVFNARYAESTMVKELRNCMNKAKHSKGSIFVYNASREPVRFQVDPSFDPLPVPNGFKEEADIFNIPDSQREYIPEIVYKEALIPDFESDSVKTVEVHDTADRVNTEYKAYLNTIPWEGCQILHRIVLKTVKEDSNGLDAKTEELVIDTPTLISILQKISIRKGVPDIHVPPVTISSLYGPMWFYGKTCFVDDKSIGDYTERAAEAFRNKYEDITKYYKTRIFKRARPLAEFRTLAKPKILVENNNKALEAAMQISKWMVDPPKSCDEYSMSNEMYIKFVRELLPLENLAKHTEIFNKKLGKSGIKKVLGYTANERTVEFGKLRAEEQAAKQKAKQAAEQASENQASGTPEKGTAIVRYTNSSGATTKYEIQFEDLSLETLTIRDLAKNIITGKMEIENIKIKEDNGRKKLVCTSSDIETVKDSD